MTLTNKDIYSEKDLTSYFENVDLPISVGVKIVRNLRAVSLAYLDVTLKIDEIEKKYNKLIYDIDLNLVENFDIATEYYNLMCQTQELDIVPISSSELEGINLPYDCLTAMAYMLEV